MPGQRGTEKSLGEYGHVMKTSKGVAVGYVIEALPSLLGNLPTNSILCMVTSG